MKGVARRILVAGAGWLGGAIARALLVQGSGVVVARRTAAALAPLVEAGAEPLAVDLAAPGAASAVPGDVGAIVACQSSGTDTPDAYRAAYVDATRSLLEAAERLGVEAFVYTGSTGVFGQRDGSSVEEATPPAPSGPTGSVLVEAEEVVRGAAERGVPARIVRLSGLYGPGRSGILDRVRSGRLALGPGDGAWMNFCHLDDAVAFVLAALRNGTAGETYHGSDAEPATRREVVAWIAARLGIVPARLDREVPGPNRQVRSDWSRRALGVSLRYPSFRDGLDPLLPAPGAGERVG